MGNKLCIIICENYIKEAQEVLCKEKYKDVILSTYSSAFELSKDHKLKNIEEVYLKYRNQCNRFLIIGGGCLPNLEKIHNLIPNCNVYKLEYCFHLLLNKNIIIEYLEEGQYLVTPGMLENWRTSLEHCKLNKEKCYEDFKVNGKKIILLDTGISIYSEGLLKEFSRFKDLPYKFIKVGLDYFQLFIEKIVSEWRLEIQRTEELRAIKALKESEDRYRRIVEMSTNGIFIYSDNIIEYVNPTAVRIIGAENEEQLLGKSIFQFIHPDFQRVTIERINRMYKNYKSEMQIEEKLITLDGNIVEVEIMPIPLKYEEKLSILCIAKDVTKRNEAQRIAKEKDAQLRQITNNMSDIIAQSNALGIYNYVSPSCEKILGYTQEEMLGKTCVELVHPEDQGRTMKLFNRIIQKYVAQRIEFRYKHAKGHYLWLESIGTPIINERGAITAISFISRDITNRKLIEEKLRENQAQYRKLIEVLPEAIFVHNDNKIIFCNEAAAHITGVEKPEDLINTSVLELIPEERKNVHLQRFHTVIKEKKVQPFIEGKLINKNKEIIDVEVGTNFFPYGGKNNVLDVVRNIKDRKQMELLKKDVEQSNRLLNETLEYERLRTEFFSNISHEFRTPLNVILGAVQLWSLYEKNGILKDQSGKVKKQVKMMKQNCYRLLRLINNLIDITKIDSNFYEISLKNQNIVEVIETITLSVAEYIESKGLLLQFDTEIEECILACDSDKIERIILNLLSNSVKFSKAGSEIFVSIYYKNNEVIISIRDTGIGIPKDKLEIIFERFRQVDKSLTRSHEGSGIGLSLVKSLVELHNGTIEVKSEYGKGSEFIISIPMKTIEEEQVCEIMHNQQNKQSIVERIHVEFSDIYS